MCDTLPPTKDPPENYQVDNVLRSVGQVVTVFCKNKTVAVVKCMPDLRWNATVPPCTLNDNDNMSTVLIIVWVVGGILLFSLLILIVIIATARSKTRCNARRSASSPSTSVFHISGRGRGGDNPAFSRADERCGEWSFHRASDLPDTAQLPSYQEAILNNYITVPAVAGNGSQQERPTFIRANAPPSYRTSQLQSVRGDGGSESTSVTSSQGTVPHSNPENNQSSASNSTVNNECSSAGINQITAEQVTNQITAIETNPPVTTNQRRASTCQTSSATSEQVQAQQTNSSSSSSSTEAEADVMPASRRYAENYPQCFFEEEPPPPYSPGPSNYNLYRSSGLQQNPRGNNNWRRSLHAYPFVHSSNVRQDGGFCIPRVNPNFRRSCHDRPQISDSQVPLSSSQDSPSIQNNPGNTRAHSRHYDSSFESRHTVSGTDNINCSSMGNHPSLHSRSNGNYTDMQAHQLGPSSNALKTNSSNVPRSNSCANQPNQISTISMIGGGRNNDITDNTRTHESDNRETLYVIRNIQATPSAPPFHMNSNSFPSSSHMHRIEVQPLGTSTPINQSPVQVRRFIPANHPSPLPIARNKRSRSHQENIIPHSQQVASQRGYARKGNQVQFTYPSSPHFSQSRPSHVIHSRGGSAPLARFEGDYL